MSFFVNPARAAGLLLAVTGFSSVAHAGVPLEHAACSTATITGTYQGSGSGRSRLETPGSDEPETHNVRLVADGMGNFTAEMTHFVRGRQTRQFKDRKGTYTVDAECNIVFRRPQTKDDKQRDWIGTVTADGNKMTKRTVQADYEASHVMVRVPPQ